MGSAPVQALDEGYYIEDEANPGQYKLIRVAGQKTANAAVGSYWLLFGILCALGTVIPFGGGAGGGIIILLIFLPGVQITASFASLLAVAFRGGSKPEYQQIGKITLFTVLGTLLGLGIMWLTCIGSSGFTGW